MSSIWTTIKNLFTRKNNSADSSKEKAVAQTANQRVQRKHTYDEIEIKENDQTASANPVRIHPYDSIEVDEGKVNMGACSSETLCSQSTVMNSDCLNKLTYVELDFGEKEKKEGKQSDKPIQIIGAGSSVDYTEIQIQH